MPIIKLKTVCCDVRIESILLDVNVKRITGLRGAYHRDRPRLNEGLQLTGKTA